MPIAHRREVQRYLYGYRLLLRLYPPTHYERFGEGMQQTFNDLLRARMRTGSGCAGFAFGLFVETLVWIIKANLSHAMQKKHLVRPAIATGLLLLLPLVMTFLDRGKAAGDGWHWGPGDFVAMGVLLFGAGLAYELLASRTGRKAHRIAGGTCIALVVFAIWVELAVDGVSQVIKLAFG